MEIEMTPQAQEIYDKLVSRFPITHFSFTFKRDRASQEEWSRMIMATPAIFELYLLGLINFYVSSSMIDIASPHEIAKVRSGIVKRSQDDELGKLLRENGLPTVY